MDADDILECIFLNKNIWIPIKGPINTFPVLLQIMLGSVQVTSHYLNQSWLIYQRIYASVGLNELRGFYM